MIAVREAWWAWRRRRVKSGELGRVFGVGVLAKSIARSRGGSSFVLAMVVGAAMNRCVYDRVVRLHPAPSATIHLYVCDQLSFERL